MHYGWQGRGAEKSPTSLARSHNAIAALEFRIQDPTKNLLIFQTSDLLILFSKSHVKIRQTVQQVVIENVPGRVSAKV